MPKLKLSRISRTAPSLQVAALVAVLGFGHTLVAQDAPVEAGQTATLSVTTRLVVLDVVVTDKKGKLVDRKLTRDDFQIVDTGEVQRIRHFETPDEHSLPVSDKPVVNSAADLAKIGDAPVTILVLDELNTRFEDMAYSRQMMVKYLQAQTPVLHDPTVLMIATNNTFQQVHDYTQNRDELIEVVKKHMPEYPWRLDHSQGGGDVAVERMAQTLGALRQLAEASTGTPGRKNLIWVGMGFHPVDLVGMADDDVTTIENVIKQTTSRLLAARITMYTIDPTAGTSATIDIETPDDLDTAVGADGAPFDSGSVGFSDFAPSTGGIAFRGRNDIENVIGEGIAKGRNYYTLTYSPSDKSADPAKFRNVRVVMKDPNLHATTRDGYFPESAADLNPVLDKTMPLKQVQANLKLDISGALTSTISYNGLTVTQTKSGPAEYTLHVSGNGIGWTEPDAQGRSNAEATVAAAWYDAKGKMIDHVIREETFAKTSTGVVLYKLPITLPAKAVRLRFVVRDAHNGHMGTADVTKF